MRSFEAFTWQHYLPLIFFLISGVILIYWGIRLNEHSPKKKIGMGISLITWFFMVSWSVYKIFKGSYLIEEDLPIYLCRLMAWLLPVIILLENRKWIGIFYFWILAGTLQALITPDLAEGFPTYPYLRYWFLHAGLVVGILYYIIVFKVRITWKDFVNAVLYIQVYLVLIHLINMALKTNYSYTMHKPPGGSLLDVLGPWPLYILAGQGIMVILFTLLIFPFIIRKTKPAVEESS